MSVESLTNFLLPCPFCGSTQLRGPYYGSTGDQRSGEFVWIECEPCGIEMNAYGTHDLSKVVDKWNKRHAVDPPA